MGLHDALADVDGQVESAARLRLRDLGHLREATSVIRVADGHQDLGPPALQGDPHLPRGRRSPQRAVKQATKHASEARGVTVYQQVLLQGVDRQRLVGRGSARCIDGSGGQRHQVEGSERKGENSILGQGGFKKPVEDGGHALRLLDNGRRRLHVGIPALA
jgi:hypothetical protein